VTQAEDFMAELIPEWELADTFGKTLRTLRNWRKNKEAPPWCRVGRDVFYFRKEVGPWLLRRKRAPLRQRAGASQ
jgi:hypothetical protein